ncbi:MAG TPA: DUF4382 domain-containing protein [Gemmatimonadota bacterium]|nr:DUF4382 domain-containing protein [Gemmatimonadota bacterium]
MDVRRGATTLFLVAACGALAACGDSTGPGGTRLDVQMHDASGRVKSAWVSVTKVYADGPNGRVDLTGSSSGMIELTSLQNGATATIASGANLDAGTYSNVHVVFGDAAVETEDGTVYGTSADLSLPGASASVSASLSCSACGDAGVEVALPGGTFDARADAQNTLLVDFDLRQSVQADLTGGLVLQPVLTGSDAEEDTGAIAGNILVSAGSDTFPIQCGGRSIAEGDFYGEFFIPQATAQNETDGNGNAYVKSGAGHSGGTYVIPELPADTYSLDAVSSFSFDNGDRLSVGSAPDSSRVDVTSADTANVDFHESVSCVSAG